MQKCRFTWTRFQITISPGAFSRFWIQRQEIRKLPLRLIIACRHFWITVIMSSQLVNSVHVFEDLIITSWEHFMKAQEFSNVTILTSRKNHQTLRWLATSTPLFLFICYSIGLFIFFYCINCFFFLKNFFILNSLLIYRYNI